MRPKLLLVADTYYPLRDGVLKFIEEFVKRPSTRFDVSVLVPKLSKIHLKNAKTIFFNISKRFKASLYSFPEFSLRNFRKIKNTIKENDIIFSNGPAFTGVYLSLRYARKYKKKTVFYIHNTAWDFLEKYFSLNKVFSRFVQKFFVKLYNKWDLLVVPYKEVEHELKKVGVKTKIVVARLGVNITQFFPNKNKEEMKNKLHLPNKTVVGYVGRICKEKNTLVILDAFKKLDHIKYHLLIVGDGNEKIVKKFKENRNCTVTGFVENVHDYLKAMDIFVMPSLTETTSLATLEAMATGLPVIATKVGFIKKYITKNHNGLFFPKNSPTMLAMKIEKLRKDPELSRKLGHNARNTVAYSFSWERSINKIKRILLEEFYR